MHTSHILWKTIHSLSNRAPPPILNTSITFSNKIATTPKHIANCFTKQFTNTVKHVTHKTNRSINRATHKIQGYKITLTTTQVQEAIKQSKNNNSKGPDKLNIRHLIANTLEKSLLHYLTANIPNTPTQYGYKTLYGDGTTYSKQHRSKGVQLNGHPARTITVALDMSKAFDIIHIHTLIRKLLQTNIPGTIIKFITNYIKGHKAYTTYINHTSSQR